MKGNRIYWYILAAAVMILIIAVSCGRAEAAGNAAEAHKPGKDLHDVYEYTKQVHTYANGNSEAIKWHGKQINGLKENKVDKTVFVADQARQDKATAEAQAKADSAANGVATNGNAIAATDKVVTRHTGEIKDLQGRATQADLGIEETKAVNTAQGKTLDEHGSRLDGHDAQFAGIGNVNAALNTRLGGAYQRLDAHERRISGLERDMDKANEANAISLAVAGHQFDTKGGFQTAISVSTVNSREALAIGMGGALSERVFINAGVANSGNTTGGVVSSTYSW